MRRTHKCGELRTADIGKNVILSGWTQRVRDLGGLVFLDLRDRYGLVQVVIDPSKQQDLAEKTRKIPRESVVMVEGTVQARPENMVNREMATGEIEVLPELIEIFSESADLPIPFEEIIDAGEDLRLKYRYLELRRPYMQSRLQKRHKLALTVRKYLDERGFWEIDTPYFMRSTPEGARDFLVPSRQYPGRFYALPQSPQTYKQILMISGIDKYFQIVRCFRDEDFRADRQPEFTQIDMEMSFVEEEDVFAEVEGMMETIFREVAGLSEVQRQIPRMTYQQAISSYGTDKPDIRFDLKLVDVSEEVRDSGFQVFDGALAEGGIVVCLPLENIQFSRKQIDELFETARKCGLAGIVAGKWDGTSFSAPLGRFFTGDSAARLAQSTLKGNPGTALFTAGEKKTILKGMGQLRLNLAQSLQLKLKPGLYCLWVTDFPLFEVDDEGRITSSHHPFTAPNPEDLDLLEADPLKVRSRAYDLVINGFEIASGSIRIHKRELQEKIFGKLGVSKAEAEEKFGFLLKAFEYGVPPHGGIAFGFDRLLMLLCQANSIREVIPFPKTTSGLSLMDGSPASVSSEQLKELGLTIESKNK